MAGLECLETTVAAKEAKQARKEAVQAPPSEFKEKTKAADAAQQRKVAADRQVAQAERELRQANLTAERAARKGQPGTWRLVPERLKRLAKGVAAGAARVLGNILGPFKRLKDAVLDGVPVLEGVTPDGQKIYFGRGDKMRAPLMRYAGSSQRLSGGQKNPWEKLVEQVQKSGRLGKPLTKDEIEKAKQQKVLPKDMSKTASPKSKHILNKKFKLKGKLCSCVPESREAEVESDFADIVSGKIQPVWMETLDSQGLKKIAPVFKGKGGILYRFGHGENANTPAIIGGKDVLQVAEKEIDALREIVKNGMDVEKACKKRSVESEKIKKILTDFSLSGENK